MRYSTYYMNPTHKMRKHLPTTPEVLSRVTPPSIYRAQRCLTLVIKWVPVDTRWQNAVLPPGLFITAFLSGITINESFHNRIACLYRPFSAALHSNGIWNFMIDGVCVYFYTSERNICVTRGKVRNQRENPIPLRHDHMCLSNYKQL
jgi:hypothetical protein